MLTKKMKGGVGGGLRKGRLKARPPAKRTRMPYNARKRATKGKMPSISKLIKQADKILSDQVRQMGVDKDGMQTCYTCGHKNHWKKLHCSHYLSRYYKAARWNRDNVRPACFMCNIYKKGDLVVFRRNLINEIGEARVLDVEKLRDAPIKLSREYLQNLIISLQGE